MDVIFSAHAVGQMQERRLSEEIVRDAAEAPDLHECMKATIGAGLGTFPHVWRGRLANWLGDVAVI